MSAVSSDDPDDVGRVPAGQRRHEAGHGRPRRDAGRVDHARRHRLPHVRRGQRRARAADPAPRAGRGRGRQHARDLRRQATGAASRSSTSSSSSARGARARPPTATTGCATRLRPRRTSRSRWPSRSSRSASSATGSCPTAAAPGGYRGGLAIERTWRTLVPDTTLQVRSDRQNHAPYGLYGGLPGGVVGERAHERRGARRSYPPMFSTTIGSGTVYHHRMAGGGGWGDPLERDPAAVARRRAQREGERGERARALRRSCSRRRLGRRRRATVELRACDARATE